MAFRTLTVFVWKIRDKNGYEREGVLDTCIDVNIETFIKEYTSADKCLWDVQKFLDANYKERGYKFTYRKTKVKAIQ